MAIVKSYDSRCYDLAEVFLADMPKFNNEIFKNLLALEIQQVIEDETSFMENGVYDENGKFRMATVIPENR